MTMSFLMTMLNIAKWREADVKNIFALFTLSSHQIDYAACMKNTNVLPVLLVVMLPLLISCSNAKNGGGVDGYPSAYLAAIGQDANHPQAVDPASLTGEQAEALATFQHVFAHLTEPGLANRIHDSYANTFYFNDTFKTLHSRDDLTTYLQKTAARATVKMTPLAVFGSGRDYYLKWYMQMRYRVLGKDQESDSIGITHIRLNAQGKIVLQQDFWDGVEGFYQDLPVIGGWLKHVRGGL